MEPFNIRTVIPADLDAAAAVEAACFPPAEAAGRASLSARIQAFPECFLVAEIDGRIIGFVNGAVIDQDTLCDEMFGDTALHNPHGHWQSIFGLSVSPEFRRHGVAARLMEQLIAAARQAGRMGLVLTCKEHLIAYYEKFGYQNRGVSRSQHGGAVWYDMVLTF